MAASVPLPGGGTPEAGARGAAAHKVLMARNDVVLLDGILDQRVTDGFPSSERDEVFEYFAFEQLLKDYDFSREELESGWLDGRNDGGIDGLFVIVSGQLIQDPDRATWPRRNAAIDVWIITGKHHATFQQAPLDTLYASLSELLDLGIANEDLRGSYSDALLAARLAFYGVYKQLAGSATLSFNVVYASRGDTGNIGESVRARADQIHALLEDLFSDSVTRFSFVGATELLALWRKTKTFSLSLPFIDFLAQSGEGYVLLARLRDYYEFVTDDNGSLRRYLFDSNVRDYLGDNTINLDISATLNDANAPEFWWMNNGVTILATDAPVVGKEIQLHDVQIVNGLQTTESVFRHFSEGGVLSVSRGLLIKVIVSDDLAVRDRIIRATNSQSIVEPASLRATDKIQRDIEAILERSGWFYERRKNYFRNIGKPPARFVTPMYIAAGCVALVLRNPQKAVALRQRFMRNPTSYEAVFSEKTPLAVWPQIVEVLKRCESFLEVARPSGRSGERFFARTRTLMALIAVSRVYGSFNYSVDDLISLDVGRLDDGMLQEIWGIIQATRKSANAKELTRTEARLCCEAAATAFSISDLQVLGRRGPSFTDSAPTKVSESLIDEVDRNLPPQPWKRQVHLDVAKALQAKPIEVSAAIQALINRGRRHTQIDGIVYDDEGTIIAIDETRRDEILKKHGPDVLGPAVPA